tara:strand:- start:416 stop:727 length:312 start_codon:yes stop_codon:yes gene_type:complete
MPDRSTYRTYDDVRLIEDAKYDPNRELAIALGERLADVLAELDERIGEERERAADFERDANKLDDRLYELGLENDKLELMLGVREDEINSLREQIEALKKETK